MKEMEMWTATIPYPVVDIILEGENGKKYKGKAVCINEGTGEYKGIGELEEITQ